MLLWRSFRNTNFAGVLSTGLRTAYLATTTKTAPAGSVGNAPKLSWLRVLHEEGRCSLQRQLRSRQRWRCPMDTCLCKVEKLQKDILSSARIQAPFIVVKPGEPIPEVLSKAFLLTFHWHLFQRSQSLWMEKAYRPFFGLGVPSRSSCLTI